MSIDEESLRGAFTESFEIAMESAGFKVKNRVRGGGKKVQRKKRVSARKGFTYDGGSKKLNRIDAKDRHAMSRRSKKSAIKAKAKKTSANIKRAKSNRMRKSLGFDKK